MENLYRYKVDEFHWVFTDMLKDAATIRYDLHYNPEDRSFFGYISSRTTMWDAWGNQHPVFDERLAELRALLRPVDLAACAAASMVEASDEN